MLYAGKSHDLTKLEDALSGRKLTAEEVEICMEFLDTTKERDYSVLEKIKVKNSEVSRWDYSHGNIDTAVAHCIIHPGDEELVKRYAIFCYALSGCLGIWLMQYIAEKREETCLCALTEYTGDEFRAKGIMLAMKYIQNNRMEFNEYAPEVCLAAARDCVEDYRGTAFRIAAAVLDPMPIPENIDDVSDLVNGLVDVIKLSSRCKWAGCSAQSIVAVHYSRECREQFIRDWEKNGKGCFRTALDSRLDLEKLMKFIMAEKLPVSCEHIECTLSTVSYINNMRYYYYNMERPDLTPYVKWLAAAAPVDFAKAIRGLKDARFAKDCNEMLRGISPKDAVEENELRDIAQRNFLEAIPHGMKNSPELIAYVTGETELDEAMPFIVNDYISALGNETALSSYFSAFGADRFISRFAALYVICYDSGDWSRRESIEVIFGVYDMTDRDKNLAAMMVNENVPMSIILDHGIDYASLAPYGELIAAVERNSLSAGGRYCYIGGLNAADPMKYKELIFAAADDSTKAVRELLCNIIPDIPDCGGEVEKLLTSKKAAVRELAVDIMGKMSGIDWSECLKNAFEREKSQKLKDRIGALIGAVQPVAETPESGGNTANVTVSAADLAEKIAKGTKVKKLDWLYQTAFSPVHFNDGGDVPEKVMKAALLCYAGDDAKTGKELCADIQPDELAKFAGEVLGKWLDGGADAKQKWILIFAAVNGGDDIVDTFVYYIKYWVDNMRGAMAAAAVRALALNGGAKALMQVDSMARKFKGNQVRSAANEAMADAADFLGITPEELADRIVPDFGFDERMCRTFDYGNRQFSVYLTPSLELQIYNGDKQVKNLPKPGVSDDSEKAEAAYNAFKDMKKQLKTAVSVQKARLEYALMCERKWTAESWEKLFVKNPVMHCFAIGLIWGIYEGGRLLSTFRYMDDGSFTTVDEDEFTIPEGAEISLVHPVELTAEEVKAWQEQLSDYEIAQPIPQLSREIFAPTDAELEAKEITRFDGECVSNLALLSKLLKFGWYKGQAQDAGFFYEFRRYDVTHRITGKDGKPTHEGWGAELTFSGMYIGAFSEDMEDITVEKLTFRRLSDEMVNLPVKDVSRRYFSEIIMQLTQCMPKDE